MSKNIKMHFMDVIFTLELFEDDWYIRIGNELLNGPGYPDRDTAKKVAHKYISETYTKGTENV